MDRPMDTIRRILGRHLLLLRHTSVLGPLLLAFVLPHGLSAQERPSFEGTWELISYRIAYPDSVVVGDTTSLREIKLLTPTHFAWVLQTPAKQFLGAGAGRYSIEGGTYTEVLEYASDEQYRDVTARFNWRLEGDRWLHSGKVGGGSGAYHLEAVYRRIR